MEIGCTTLRPKIEHSKYCPLLCLIVVEGEGGSNIMQQAENYQDFLKWRGKGGTGGLVSSFFYDN